MIKLKLPRKVKKEALNLVIGWTRNSWGYTTRPRVIPNKHTRLACKICNKQTKSFYIGKYCFPIINPIHS